MRPKVKLRELSDAEQIEIRKLAKSANAANKMVKRATIIVGMLDDPALTATDAGVRAGFSNAIGANWVKRYNEEGIDGLLDRKRSGRKRLHDEKTRSKLISLALQKPRSLAYPFELWTLQRLQTAFRKETTVNLARSTILKWMSVEGFNWKRQQSWFRDVEKHDPEFVEKRGPLSELTETQSQALE